MEPNKWNTSNYSIAEKNELQITNRLGKILCETCKSKINFVLGSQTFSEKFL